MGFRALLKRIERTEEAFTALCFFSPNCICFPEKEQPCFCSAFEEPVADGVKCPLHGDRFKRQQFFVYVAAWRQVKVPARRQHLSAQYRKAWEASFPPELWPAIPHEERVDGQIFFRLKDGAKLLVGECSR